MSDLKTTKPRSGTSIPWHFAKEAGKYISLTNLGFCGAIWLISDMQAKGDITASPNAAQSLEFLRSYATLSAIPTLLTAVACYKQEAQYLTGYAKSLVKRLAGKESSQPKEITQMPSMPWHQLEQNSEPIRASSLVSEDESKQPVPIPRQQQKGR